MYLLGLTRCKPLVSPDETVKCEEGGGGCAVMPYGWGITSHGNAMAKNSIPEWNFCTAAPLPPPTSPPRQSFLTVSTTVTPKASHFTFSPVLSNGFHQTQRGTGDFVLSNLQNEKMKCYTLSTVDKHPKD